MAYSFLVLILLITNCATYDDRLKSFLGTHIEDRIAGNGVPSKVMDLSGGRKMYEWSTSNGSSFIANPAPYGMSTVEQINRGCTTDLMTDKNGIITGYSYRGNTCN